MANLTVGTGPDQLALRINQDAWMGSARFTVSVDGRQVGGVLTAEAAHSSGRVDTVTVRGAWAPGPHTVTLRFLNDAYAGSPRKDRNLYLAGAKINGRSIPNTVLALMSSGPVSFGFSIAGQPPVPAPVPTPTPTPTPTPVPTPTKARPLCGVYVGNEPAQLAQHEGWLGRPVQAVLAYTGDRDWWDMDPGWIMDQFRGRTLLFSIPLFPQVSTLAAVASGAGDAYFRTYAQKIAARASEVAAPGGSIYVRTGWEMGADWFPWGAQGNGRPDLFIAAFRRFADAFHAVSPAFKVVWDVVGDRGDVAQFWPGDAYVDVVSQDFYWAPEWDGTDPAKAFAYHRDVAYGLRWIEDFAKAHGKPTAYSEWGVPAGLDATVYIQAVKAWVEDPGRNVLYHTVWDSDAAYPGCFSDGSDPRTGAAYRAAFG